MTASIAALVLFAALLHATWNAVLKSGQDRLWSMNIMGLASALGCAVLLPFVPPPAKASWICIAASALLHMGYNVFLIRAYRSGEFGSTYPIARGSSPLLVTLGAALTAKELPGPAGLAGIVLVSGGIISLAFQGRRPREAGIFYALGTGAFIAAYSVTDGMGGRLSGNAVGYTLWMSLFSGLSTLPIYLVRRRGEALRRGWRETGLAAGGGILSLLAYGIVIVAMTRAPMGSVSALRETSVLFAVLLARMFFNEQLTARRILSAVVIAAGALCLE